MCISMQLFLIFEQYTHLLDENMGGEVLLRVQSDIG